MDLPGLCLGLNGRPEDTEAVLDSVGQYVDEVLIAAPPAVMASGRSLEFPATDESIARNVELASRHDCRVGVLFDLNDQIHSHELLLR